MPTKTVWVAPEEFLTHKGVTVYHTYKENDIDDCRHPYCFTTCGTSDDEFFDVWKLDVPSKDLLKAHPPYLTVSNPEYLTATPEVKAEWTRQWTDWHNGGEARIVAAILKEAIDLGLIPASGA